MKRKFPTIKISFIFLSLPLPLAWRVCRVNFVECVGADVEVLSRNQRGEIYRAISQDNSRPV